MKKRRGKFFFIGGTLVVVSLLTTIKAQAVPASQGDILYQQPNGVEVKATQYGDEFFHYTVGEDGSLYTKKTDGYWYYETKESNTRQSEAKVGIDPKPKNVKAQSDLKNDVREEKRNNFNQKLLTNQNNSLSKDQNLLVVLVEFNDVKFSTSVEEWQKKIFSTEGKTVKNFFSEQTNQRIVLQPAKETSDVKNGILKLSLNRNHPDSGDGSGFNSFKFSADTLQQVKNQVDFSIYDTNQDKRIERNELHVMLILAGYEHSTGNYGKGVWGHKGWSSHLTTVNGLKFTDFTMFGEKMKFGSNEVSSTMGVITHEFGHDLGLPDLYNTTGEGYGLGIMSLMSSGSWGAEPNELSGITPVGLDAYSKMLLGFPLEEVNQKQHDEKKIRTLLSGEIDPTILKLQSQNQNEYFLLENRQLNGFDKGMSRYTGNLTGGIAVYRVNTEYSGNIGIGRQLVTVLEADESLLGYSKYEKKEIFGSNPFYYGGKNLSGGQQPTQINTKTRPSTKLADGSFLETSVTVMSDSANEMTIKIGDVTIEKIEIQSKEVLLEQDESIDLEVIITPENATNKEVSWSSSNEQVATVSTTGKVTAKANGTATIAVATADGKIATSKIIVKEPVVPVTGISIMPTIKELSIGAKETLQATVTPENATNKKVTWSSSDQSVVTISENGEVTGKSAGQVTITAKTVDGNKEAKSVIKVIDDDPDDHGDTGETATKINVGEVVKGKINSSSDIDVFEMKLESGVNQTIVLESPNNYIPKWTVRLNSTWFGPFAGEKKGIVQGQYRTTYFSKNPGDNTVRFYVDKSVVTTRKAYEFKVVQVLNDGESLDDPDEIIIKKE
ncbi:M6 family metalloprotease domain-containing protein [Enterococcus rotai]|uniref:M6 family metalloprotease domain-containing protein n=1 Tax=Enterococcus rotai TaxID=118060 RepID=UPI0035C712AC